MRRFVPRWTLTAFVVALAGCGGGGAFPELADPVASKPDDDGIVTLIRPQVARVGDDPIRVVLHWQVNEEPIGRKARINVDWFETCNSITVHVTTPAGDKLALKPKRQTNLVRISGGHYLSPTLFVTLTSKGVEIPSLKFNADWEGGPVEAFETSGTFEVSASGEFTPGGDDQRKNFASIPFASGVIRVERGVAGFLPLADVGALARKKLGSKIDVNHRAEEVVYDDVDGNRLAHLTGPSGKLWHVQIYTVRLTPAGKVLNVFTKDVSTCIAEGTTIDGEAGPVAVEDVRVGDRVFGYDLDKQSRVLTTVRDVRGGRARETLRLGCGLRLTADHPVYASGEWRQAGTLRGNDELLRSDGTRVRVGEIERERGTAAVFDLTVDAPHNFFAGGVLVHNKSRDHWPQLDDLWYRLWSPGGLDPKS